MNSDKTLQRLELKRLADEIRYSWMVRGTSDVFDILDQLAIVIRTPHVNSKGEMLSGFSTYIRKHFVVYLNSRYTLGHERFTAAHELYHLYFDKDVLKNKKILDNDKVNEQRANTFAVEFLMPEEGVREFVHNRIQGPLQAKHIIRLQHHFQVSYKAMLKRLLELEICDINEFNVLVTYCSLENADVLKKLTVKEGFPTSLIQPTNIVEIPHQYIETFIENYEQGNISYKKFTSLLKMINKSPVDLGFKKPQQQEVEE